MPRINQLPHSVITKIAAGEVIERPASVVKELLENSVDAGSTRIDVDVDQGGTELIRVVDDGCGIVAEDLPLAFASHATSKLRDADDLFNIATMGFRGEALASIAGIAKVTLQSRPPDQPTGAEIRCDGGDFSPVRPWNGSPGTRIEVRHLFFNVPVRKKFLKSVATELGHVCETVTRLALANPHLHIVLRHNGKLVYEIPASAGLADRIGLFFTGEVRDALYEIDSGPGPLRLTGFIADPKCDRGNAKLQYLFVNGRWFRDRSVAHAMQESYRGLLMTGRYAVGFLFLTVPPEKVDVNVHPTKAEVRFQENSLIYSLVRSTVKARLLKENLVPHLQVPAGQEVGSGTPEADDSSLFSPRRELAEQTVAPWEMSAADFGRLEAANPPGDPFQRTPPLPDAERFTPLPRPEPSRSQAAPLPVRNEFSSPFVPARTTVQERLPFTPPKPEPVSEAAPASAPPSAPIPQPVVVVSEEDDSASTPAPDTPETSGESEPAPQQPAVPAPQPFPLPSPGSALQVHDSYLVLETKDGMLVIDQHALHERILFEQLRRRIREGKLEVQRLLIPEPIDLPAEQAALVLEAADALHELGLEVSDFGGNTVLLSSYPTLLGRKPPHEIFQGVVDYLLTKERPPTKDAMLHDLMATMACKAAVKAGDRLTSEEIAYLLHLRQMAEDSHHCPHGRPTSLLFSRHELDKQFRRI